jgi:hypothetical protein
LWYINGTQKAISENASRIHKKLKQGPKRKLSDSARKRNKNAANAKLNKNRTYIGDEYDLWNEIKTALRQCFSIITSCVCSAPLLGPAKFADLYT